MLDRLAPGLYKVDIVTHEGAQITCGMMRARVEAGRTLHLSAEKSIGPHTCVLSGLETGDRLLGHFSVPLPSSTLAPEPAWSMTFTLSKLGAIPSGDIDLVIVGLHSERGEISVNRGGVTSTCQIDLRTRGSYRFMW